MARPQRNNVDYFPHPTRNGKKMRYLIRKYGDKGYTVWYGLLENLGHADYHFLNLNNPLESQLLASDLNCGEDVMLQIIEELVILEEFDKELWETGKILYGQPFVDSIEDAYLKRSNSIINRSELIKMLVSKGELKGGTFLPIVDILPEKGTVSTQSKEENSKEENSIIEWFENFWSEYHRITGKAKTDKEAALKHWKKLTNPERNQAVFAIALYFKSLNDPKYCKKARTYLADKNFNDEFKAVSGEKSSVTVRPWEA